MDVRPARRPDDDVAGPRADPSHPRRGEQTTAASLASKLTIRASNGAYAIWPFTAGLDSGQASENVPGPYDIAAYEREVYAVATNKAPMGPYRGVGRIAACFSIERTIDEIAHRLGLDPIEVRRRNVSAHISLYDDRGTAVRERQLGRDARPDGAIARSSQDCVTSTAS